MTLKRAIKEAITNHSPRFRAKKVWSIRFEESDHFWKKDDGVIWIEVSVVKKKKQKK